MSDDVEEMAATRLDFSGLKVFDAGDGRVLPPGPECCDAVKVRFRSGCEARRLLPALLDAVGACCVLACERVTPGVAAAVAELFWPAGLWRDGDTLAALAGSNRILNVVTPVSRPELLPRVRDSLKCLTRHVVRWYALGSHLVDGAYRTELVEHREDWGSRQRNRALDLIRHGVVYFLDDDNAIHPAFEDALLSHRGGEAGVVFSQADTYGRVLRRAARENARHGHIDLGQFVLTREAIGRARFRVGEYAADWRFFWEVLRSCGGEFRYADEVATYYNYLRPTGASDSHAGG